MLTYLQRDWEYTDRFDIDIFEDFLKMLSPYNIGVVHKSFTVKLGPVVPSIEIKSAQDVVVNVNV